MAAASDQTKQDVINAVLRGIPLPLPTQTWIALHTGDPGGAGTNEVTLDQWPGYLRRHAEQGGAIGSGWSAAVDGESKNSNQITYPSYNGELDLTVTHWSVFYESTGGTMRIHAPLQTARTLKTGDVFVFDINALTASQD
ncbi:MAG: Bcep22 gp60 [Alphaproteobacteria bacterium]|jgi:hypothetical protein|nr:Bcep22 gp60 [Alphaproteobacteria bacterium]